ncbi:hypothetical protein [Roseibium suaedae]|uniref:Uncharacterized protein n=1 Tax=Roseibium suaedae TaxID=735517 RepID=A0A1M7BPR9_9HYPH|nr:hypothetical protein [Roseibium suaedae]SHL56964.1 hypothetical protein SAMN05444272_0922 [Roseibium suaedae]
MVTYRPRLECMESLHSAINGYQHVPADVLVRYLIDHYTVDLDLLVDYLDGLSVKAEPQRIAA